MGIIKAFFNSLGGGLADQWEEVIEADGMSDTTVFVKGVKVRKNDKRNNNKKGTEDVISNGSVIIFLNITPYFSLYSVIFATILSVIIGSFSRRTYTG